MWYNESELRDACERIARDPELRASHWGYAAHVMVGFIDLTNSISDGWFTWSYGVKCSEDLQGLIMDSQFICRRRPVTDREIARACGKVFKFLRRCRQTKNLPEVSTFLKEH